MFLGEVGASASNNDSGSIFFSDDITGGPVNDMSISYMHGGGSRYFPIDQFDSSYGRVTCNSSDSSIQTSDELQQ